MKKPIKIYEPHSHGKMKSHLIKRVHTNTTPEPTDPPEQTFRRPTSLGYVDSILVRNPIRVLNLPPEYTGWDDNYIVEVNGTILNADGTKTLRWNNYGFDDDQNPIPGVLDYPSYNEYDCGASASITLRRNVNPPLYTKDATTATVTFIKSPGQSTDYCTDGGTRLRELNPDAEFEFRDNNDFSVYMVVSAEATPPEWRDDSELIGEHSYTGRRFTRAYFTLPTDDLLYTISFNGTTFGGSGSILNQTFTSGLYSVRVHKENNLGVIEVTYDGVVDEATKNTYVIIRLTPLPTNFNWIGEAVMMRKSPDQYDEPDNDLNYRATFYLDGLVTVNVDLWDADDTGASISPKVIDTANFLATTGMTNTLVEQRIYDRLNEVIASANETWSKWYAERTHIPEYTYEAKAMSYVTIGTGSQERKYANYTRVAKQLAVGDSWVDWIEYKLIGDGSVYHLMKTSAMVVEDDPLASYHDLVPDPNNETLTDWVNSQMGGYVNTKYAKHLAAPSFGASTVMDQQVFLAYDKYLGTELSRTEMVAADIRVQAITSVKHGTVTSPTIGGPAVAYVSLPVTITQSV